MDTCYVYLPIFANILYLDSMLRRDTEPRGRAASELVTRGPESYLAVTPRYHRSYNAVGVS